MLMFTSPAWAQDPCIAPGNGTGAPNLPPAGCKYISPDEVYQIIDGLPPGSTLELEPSHRGFDVLTILVGSAVGLAPSPGQITLTNIGDGDFRVDSFFDLSYQIDFQGAPGGELEGLAGSTRGTIRLLALDDPPPPDQFFRDGFEEAAISSSHLP